MKVSVTLTIKTAMLHLKKIGKTSIFEANGETYFASPRVANDILNYVYPEVWIQEVTTPDGRNLGTWLATPSRFN